MADDTQADTENNPAAEGDNGQETGAQEEAGQGISLNVLGQYTKDLSFESPNASQSLRSPGDNPRLDVSINVQAAGIDEDVYEVSLALEVNAKSDQGVVYNIELLYGGIFRLTGPEGDLLQRILFIDCAAILFPFARRVIADLTRDGGFPPLMLDPIDFGTLYARNIANAQAEAERSSKN